MSDPTTYTIQITEHDDCYEVCHDVTPEQAVAMISALASIMSEEYGSVFATHLLLGAAANLAE